jgi:hypothetical protein
LADILSSAKINLKEVEMGRDLQDITFASNTKDQKTGSLVTSVTFVVIALHFQISEEYNYYILALTCLF